MAFSILMGQGTPMNLGPKLCSLESVGEPLAPGCLAHVTERGLSGGP